MQPIYINYSKSSNNQNILPIKGRNKRVNLIEQHSFAEEKLMSVGKKVDLQEESIQSGLTEINEAIQESRYILNLKDDWDDEGSIGYEESTLNRATHFLTDMAKTALISFDVIIDAPKIYHGPHGSIDMLWKNENYKVLVNFPQDEQLPATFYGDTSTKESFKGSFALDSGNNLMMFLIGAKQCIR
jgi:hypothetical protein